jgi:hypothetical protein
MKSKSLPTRKVSLDGKGATIAVVSQKGDDYICVTDVARYRDSERTDYIIQNWLRNRNTIEFDGIRAHAGLNSFILTAKRWIESTGASGWAYNNQHPKGTKFQPEELRQHRDRLRSLHAYKRLPALVRLNSW